MLILIEYCDIWLWLELLFLWLIQFETVILLIFPRIPQFSLIHKYLLWWEISMVKLSIFLFWLQNKFNLQSHAKNFCRPFMLWNLWWVLKITVMMLVKQCKYLKYAYKFLSYFSAKEMCMKCFIHFLVQLRKFFEILLGYSHVMCIWEIGKLQLSLSLLIFFWLTY